jgi:hypothetical protein
MFWVISEPVAADCEALVGVKDEMEELIDWDLLSETRQTK